ncbi:14055_t:CDS:2, partial [Racocetra persica]
ANEDYVELIDDVSDKEDTPLIILISEKKSDEDMEISIPELFERMNILEDQSSQLTEDKFINSLMQYIYKNNLIRFSIVRIRQSTILYELATNVVANLNSNSKPSIQQVAALFTKILKVLVDEGFLNKRDAIFYYVNSQFVER